MKLAKTPKPSEQIQQQIIHTYANIGESHTRIKQLKQQISQLEEILERNEANLIVLAEKQKEALQTETAQKTKDKFQAVIDETREVSDKKRK